jgi:hypothetical protein
MATQHSNYHQLIGVPALVRDITSWLVPSNTSKANARADPKVSHFDHYLFTIALFVRMSADIAHLITSLPQGVLKSKFIG